MKPIAMLLRIYTQRKAQLMTKKLLLLFSAVIVAASALVFCVLQKDQEIPYEEKVLRAIGAVADDLGYNFSSLERLNTPVKYSDSDGNTIIFTSFYCSDPARIENKEVVFYTDVFDPESADAIRDAQVNDARALFCLMGERAYLMWFPDEHIILMLDYDPSSVSDKEILMMAESCR